MTESDPGGGLRDTSYDQLTRSARRMSAWRRAAYALLDPILHGLVRLLWAACRRPRIIGEEHLRAALERGPSLIPCYWHQHQLFCARYLLERRDVGLRPGFLISPAFVFKPGAILLAQMSGRPMLPMAFAASRSIRFHWDRFVVPLPGARIVVAVGEPRWVPKRIDTRALEGEQIEMARRLREAFEQARSALRVQPA